jgi:hypothetical protein
MVRSRLLARGLRVLSAVPLGMLLVGCDNAPTPDAGTKYKKAVELERAASRGKLTDGDGGFVLFGGKKEAAGASIGVNAFLWRATLDTLSFLPIASADPFGGTILTDWYEDPQAPGERFKVNAIILDKQLRADAIKVKLFKQARMGTAWADQPTNPRTERDLEDAILTRARQIKVQSLAAE